MQLKNYHVYTCIALLFTTLVCSAQSGVISGVLEDDFNIPIPGVTVIVKGTSNGIVTDFDGNYSITCKVGDILQFSSLGMKTKEINVTQELFGNQKLTTIAPKTPVNKIISNAYGKSIKTLIDTTLSSQNVSKITLYYNKNKRFFDYNRIKDIKKENNNIKISYFIPDVYYEIRFNTATSFQFIDKKKLPKLQNRFGQGLPLNGSNAWFGPETNTIFSYGPDVNTLTFDGSNYAYDSNGRLINGISEHKQLPYNNNIFHTSKIRSNNLSLMVSNIKHTINLNLRRKTQEDLFKREKGNLTQVNFNYGFNKKINVFFKLNNELNNQPDINAFYSNLLLATFATPSTFKNKQGYIFNTNTQRSFSPLQFNNPYWLLYENQNSTKSKSVVFGAKSKIRFPNNFGLNAFISFKKERNASNFGLPVNTIGFNDGYKSKKDLSKTDFFGYLTLSHENNIAAFSNIELESSITYANSLLKYKLLEHHDFTTFNVNLPSRGSLNTKNLRNDVIRFANKIEFDLNTKFDVIVTLKNNSIISSIQGNKLFLPAVKTCFHVSDLFRYSNWFDSFSIVANIAKEANDIPLFYANRSHNSLHITPQQSQTLITNNDLFNSKALDFETGTNIDIRCNLGFFYNTLKVDFNYYTSKTNNGIFPVLVNEIYELQNIASIKNKGFEIDIDFIPRNNNRFNYYPSLIFSKNRATVLKLNNAQTSIPIAGFKNVSKNLIVGEQTGSIVGSAYLRHANGSIIIDNDGFPMVATQKKIIGNTTPDFNLSLDNNFALGKINFSFLIDYQKGGDIWNGTKNVLNYLGRSQESANLRGTTNFIFSGVDPLGNTNITPVDFANPNLDVTANRWVRYGFDGVDEAAIVDGSYINLKSISCSYDFANNKKQEFFKQLELSLYANNLLSYTKASGISPYSALFNDASGSGLNYFNTPLTKEIGFKINIKI